MSDPAMGERFAPTGPVGSIADICEAEMIAMIPGAVKGIATWLYRVRRSPSLSGNRSSRPLTSPRQTTAEDRIANDGNRHEPTGMSLATTSPVNPV
jgi:hypothetical protein